jgi:hypothetical protein
VDHVVEQALPPQVHAPEGDHRLAVVHAPHRGDPIVAVGGVDDVRHTAMMKTHSNLINAITTTQYTECSQAIPASLSPWRF